jgi:hypothetical protein
MSASDADRRKFVKEWSTQAAEEVAGSRSIIRAMPAMFRLMGKPYEIEQDYFPFEPLYSASLPIFVSVMAGRQVSKSTWISSYSVATSYANPYFRTLIVTPFADQAHRLSTNYVAPFIDTSPIRSSLRAPLTRAAVGQRDLANGSQIYFSYAYTTAERVRGYSALRLIRDERQDMSTDFDAVIDETIGNTTIWGQRFHTGTPKTVDGPLQKDFNKTTQSEFATKCHQPGCGYWNIPRFDLDLPRMFGKYHKKIDRDHTGVICAKCGHKDGLQPHRFGRWIHMYPEREHEALGLHMPQFIFPFHYADPENWKTVLKKRRGEGNYSEAKFYNEVCGVSYDIGNRLLAESEVQAAAQLGDWPRSAHHAETMCQDYELKILGVDWGGNGEDHISRTALALVGFRHDGSCDVLWGHKMRAATSREVEAEFILEAAKKFGVTYIAHDYGGIGELTELQLIKAGFPQKRILPFRYSGNLAHPKMIKEHKPSPNYPKYFLSLDKAKSIQLLCHQIRYGNIRFFHYDFSRETDGLLHDLLAWIENYEERDVASSRFTVIRSMNQSDDFADAVNYACCGCWYVERKWPSMTDLTFHGAGEDLLLAAELDEEFEELGIARA